jgi:cell division protein FtsB
MSKSNPVYAFLSHNKYWIVLIVGVLIVGVLDENSFYQRVKYDLQIEELKTKIAEYNAQYERDEAQLRELRRNPKAITKIARERYFMKADDEDIFVLSDDLQPAKEEGDETAE